MRPLVPTRRGQGVASSGPAFLDPCTGVGDQTKARKKREPRPQPPDPADLTDEFNAQRFVGLYADRLRYCPALGGWLAYDGRRWSKDDTMAHQRLLGSRSSCFATLAHIKGRFEHQEFLSAIRKAESSGTITAIVKLAQSDERIAVKAGVSRRHPSLLNCLNGTIDLSTGDLSTRARRLSDQARPGPVPPRRRLPALGCGPSAIHGRRRGDGRIPPSSGGLRPDRLCQRALRVPVLWHGAERQDALA